MLREAGERIRKQGWDNNVTLVQTDAARYRFPQEMSGAISTFAITLVPEYEAIIRRVSETLGAGGRLVILDLRKPERWPEWLLRAAVTLTRPFGVTLDLAERKPWLAMEKHFAYVTYQELYGGFAFLATAENR